MNVDLTQIDEGMAEVILLAIQKHALLLFRRQSLHDDDIYRLSKALGPVEEPPAAKDNHSPRFKSVIYLANIIVLMERSSEEILLTLRIKVSSL